MRKGKTITLVAVLALAVGALSATTSLLPASAKDSPLVQAAKNELKVPAIRSGGMVRQVPTFSAALVESAKSALLARSGRAAAQANGRNGSGGGLAVSPTTLGCGKRNTDGNVRVNQDCTFRRQAEEIIKFNPADPSNLIAGTNDNRIGYNHCAFDYSFNGGQTWGDGVPPFWSHTNNPPAQSTPIAGDPNAHTVGGGPPSGHTYDAASDPVVAADSMGRAFFGCIVFDVNDNANGLIVTQSPSGAGGSFYDNVPDVAFDANGKLVDGKRFIVAEDNNAAIGHDKPALVADFYPRSPLRDNLYVTWTVFKFDPRCVAGGTQCESPIYGSMSTDHGLTWSTPEPISGASDTLCFFGNFFDPTLPPNSCNLDQGSDPIVLPNGQLEVIFNNGNTAPGNPNAQQLGVHCAPSGSSPAGTAHFNCGQPTKVGNDITVGEPFCDFGRGPEQCIPGAYIRTWDVPRIAVNLANGHLYATWQDYRNHSLDIQLSRSVDGGITWKEAGASVNPDVGSKDHYEAAIDVVASANNGGGEGANRDNGESNANSADHVAVSYYRTDRVSNENSTPGNVFAPCGAAQGGDGTHCQPGVGAENSDYTLAGGFGLDTPYAAQRISPLFPPPDGNQAGFNGDYSGLTVVGDIAHPIWSDTRNVVPQQFNA
ncbi:MAG: hypothetical protein M3Z28_06760, partial [Candidatus Dormibacteraeota bacterium]|nr:hypothetical protein [Candidatus Dormibacteraeota bacterium]